MGIILVVTLERSHVTHRLALKSLFLEAIFLLCYGHPCNLCFQPLSHSFYAPFTALAMDAHRRMIQRRQAFNGFPFDSTGGLLSQTTSSQFCASLCTPISDH